MIPFNKPYLTGNECLMIEDAFKRGRVSGNGYYTQACHQFFQEKYGFQNCFLTNGATDALLMAAILCDLAPGDEVIIPSYTFVSSATPFDLLGAKLVFCDSEDRQPNIDTAKLKASITPKTKVIVVVHYAGLACNMNEIMQIARDNNLIVIEDAAHSIDSYYNDQALGSIGHFGVCSFHETKNISCGQGGILYVNDTAFLNRAEKVWSKGTDKLDMERGLVDAYRWVDKGLNFQASEITAATLFAQLGALTEIQKARMSIWEHYRFHLSKLEEEGYIQFPEVQPHQTNNYHLLFFYCRSKIERDELLQHLLNKDILALFHYLPLHQSPYILANHQQDQSLPNAGYFSEHLIRLPLFVDLTKNQVDYICQQIEFFFVGR